MNHADSKINIWHRYTGQLLERLEGHGAGCVNAVAWNTALPSMFASAGDDCKVRMYVIPALFLHHHSTISSPTHDSCYCDALALHRLLTPPLSQLHRHGNKTTWLIRSSWLPNLPAPRLRAILESHDRSARQKPSGRSSVMSSGEAGAGGHGAGASTPSAPAWGGR